MTKNPHAKAVRTPQYKMRVVKDKKRKAKDKWPENIEDCYIEIGPSHEWRLEDGEWKEIITPPPDTSK